MGVGGNSACTWALGKGIKNSHCRGSGCRCNKGFCWNSTAKECSVENTSAEDIIEFSASENMNGLATLQVDSESGAPVAGLFSFGLFSGAIATGIFFKSLRRGELAGVGREPLLA